jgi:hypothetical protein
MKDRDKPTLAEVQENEPNPYTDRQNLEPEPAADEIEDDSADFVEGDGRDYDDDEVEFSGKGPRSDIEDYVRRDTSDAPADVEDPRNHDDDDPFGDGVHDTPITRRYEDMADRDDLARRIEELVADAYDWVGRSDDDDARDIYDTLVDLAERIGNPPEETIRTEPGELPADRDEADA